MSQALQVGAIGYRGHAATIIDIVNRSGKGVVSRIYHPSKALGLPGSTNTLDDLLECDAVMVLSPDNTHADYVSYFTGRGEKYVFCEKPPAISNAQLVALRSQPRQRVFFNFNLRFSRLREVFDQSVGDGSLGCPIHCSVVVTHGLAFKESYEDSWRARANPHLLAETVAIHYLDLFGILFGELNTFHYAPRRASGRGAAHDTCVFSCEYRGGVTTSIVASYAAPLALQIQIFGTNGTIQCDDHGISLYSPRDTFDDTGLFTRPPCVFHHGYEGGTLYGESLERSVDHFLTRCRAGQAFDDDLYDQSLRSTELILGLTSP